MDEVDGFSCFNDNIKAAHLASITASNTDNRTANNMNTLSKGDQATQCPDEIPNEVITTAEALAMDLVHHVTNNNVCKSPKSTQKYSKTLRRTVNELLEKHSILFNGMVSRLNISEQNGYQTFHNVAEEIFVDGQFNWGRIVAVYAFGARMAKHCVESNMESYVDEIGGFLGTYVATKLGAWISRNGGWAAFCDYFPEKNGFEDKMWRGLLVTAMGLGALATMVAAR